METLDTSGTGRETASDEIQGAPSRVKCHRVCRASETIGWYDRNYIFSVLVCRFHRIMETEMYLLLPTTIASPQMCCIWNGPKVLTKIYIRTTVGGGLWQAFIVV